MACGCSCESDGLDAPECATHHERRVARVEVVPPRIVAKDCNASGPLVTQG